MVHARGGWLPWIGSLTALGFICAASGGIAIAAVELGRVARGDIEYLRFYSLSQSLAVPVSISVAFLTAVAVAMAVRIVGVPLYMLHIEREQQNQRVLVGWLTSGRAYRDWFLLVIAEELVVRWLVFGSIWTSRWAMDARIVAPLTISACAAWALMQQWLFPSPKYRGIRGFLSHTVIGACQCYVMIRFGLAAAIATHFLIDALLLTRFSTREAEWSDAWRFLWGGIAAYAGWRLLGQLSSDVMLWIDDFPVYALPGWGAWDYVGLAFLTAAVVQLACECAVLGAPYQHERGRLSFRTRALRSAFWSVLMPVAMIISGHALLDRLDVPLVSRTALLAVAATWIGPPQPPSGVLRVLIMRWIQAMMCGALIEAGDMPLAALVVAIGGLVEMTQHTRRPVWEDYELLPAPAPASKG